MNLKPTPPLSFEDRLASIYELDPVRAGLPTPARAYAFLVKPLRHFLLSCVDTGNPNAFTPVATVKAAFELYLSTYLGDVYQFEKVISDMQRSRAKKNLPLLKLPFRQQAVGSSGSVKIPDFSEVIFSPLLRTVLTSVAFREELESQMRSLVLAREVPASKLLLLPTFFPTIERLGTNRYPVLMNAGIFPKSRALPDELLSMADSRFASDPEVSRETFPTFCFATEATRFLPEEAIRELTHLYEKTQRSGNVHLKNKSILARLRRAELIRAGALSDADPHFFDETAYTHYLEKTRGLCTGQAT